MHGLSVLGPVRPAYHGAFSSQSPKKGWKAGRPIVSFCAHPAKELLAATAQIVTFLTIRACPHSTHYNDALQIWKDLHAFLDSVQNRFTDDTILSILRIHNQDLAGFFISIDVDRFVVALQFLLCRAYSVHSFESCNMPFKEYFAQSGAKQRRNNVAFFVDIGTSLHPEITPSRCPI